MQENDDRIGLLWIIILWEEQPVGERPIGGIGVGPGEEIIRVSAASRNGQQQKSDARQDNAVPPPLRRRLPRKNVFECESQDRLQFG